MLRTVLVVCAVGAVASVRAAPKTYWATYSDYRRVSITQTEQAPVGWTVKAEYSATQMTTNWDVLKLQSNGVAKDENQAYAAGYLEGYLTAENSRNHATNMAGLIGQNTNDKVRQWFSRNMQWMDGMTKAQNATSDFWFHVGLNWIYYQGIFDGTQAKLPPSQQFDSVSFFIFSNLPDLMDVAPACQVQSAQRSQDWRRMNKTAYEQWVVMNSHCSALIKILPDFSDIFFGQTTWMNYNMMNRVYKVITMKYNASRSTNAKTVSMSSYGGAISSQDDFHLMDNGMVTIETSLEVLNMSLYEYTQPESLLYGYRIMTANRMATSAQEWTTIFGRYNSGTYNNEWLALDLSKFTPKKALPAGTMWISNQMPGKYMAVDATERLALGYIPSYNVPAIPEIFEYAGYPAAVAQQGPEMNSYELCVRAQIFRRDQGNVKDMASFKFLMQYNNYENDPISAGNPVYAIMARGDLPISGSSQPPMCFGALDTKAGSYSLWKASGAAVEAFGGPTPQQPVFDFNTTAAVQCGPHIGMADSFAFGWQTILP